MSGERYKAGVVFSRAQIAAAIMLLLLPIAAVLQGTWVSRKKDVFKPLLLKHQIEKVDCPYCGGVGTQRDPDQPERIEICPICFGVGSRQVRKLAGETEVLCPACSGMGRVYDLDSGTARQCLRCGGRGLIRASRKPPAGDVH